MWGKSSRSRESARIVVGTQTLPARFASSRPASVSGTSHQPVKTLLRLNKDSPCRIMTMEYSALITSENIREFGEVLGVAWVKKVSRPTSF